MALAKNCRRKPLRKGAEIVKSSITCHRIPFAEGPLTGDVS